MHVFLTMSTFIEIVFPLFVSVVSFSIFNVKFSFLLVLKDAFSQKRILIGTLFALFGCYARTCRGDCPL
jgi:hypothetical protein